MVNRIIVGSLETNCYILKKGNNCIIVDPGSDINKITECVKDSNVLLILLTHSHFDHIGALNEVKNKYNVEVYNKNNLEEKTYHFKDFTFEVIYTPGHTSDSITLYFKDEKFMLTGDFIFKNAIGRTDLETGNDSEMLASLKKIKAYDLDTIIYPGHGEESILKNELFKWL